MIYSDIIKAWLGLGLGFFYNPLSTHIVNYYLIHFLGGSCGFCVVSVTDNEYWETPG